MPVTPATTPPESPSATSSTTPAAAVPTRSSRLLFFVAPYAAFGLLFAALVERGVARLANLESPELDATGRVLFAALPPVAALLAWGLGDLAFVVAARARALGVLARTLRAGAVAGALTAAFPIGQDLFHLGHRLRASDFAPLGYVVAGAAAGLVLALFAVPVVLALFATARRAIAMRGMSGTRTGAALARTALAAATLFALVGGAALFFTRPRSASLESTLAARPPAPPEKLRGLGPEEDSPLRRHRRLVATTLEELATQLKAENASEVERVILEAGANDVLADLFTSIVDEGLYDAMEKRLHDLEPNAAGLKALADARPSYGADVLNADTLASIRARSDWPTYPYALLIIPGFTPVKAHAPVPFEAITAAVERCKMAVEDWKRGVAPYILVSGGSVHPAGTPHNEALSMRDYLLKQGVPADRILVDPFARHSTTNLRNAGRMMRDLSLARALIVTGFESSPFDQAFYFSHPVLSTFASRSRRELGFLVGELRGVDGHHIDFVPAAEVVTVNPYDPLDA